MKPMHKHDCSACLFLGTLNRVDHYACNKAGGGGVEYIQRHSSEGPGYRAISSQDLPRYPAEVQKIWQLTAALFKHS